MIVIRKELELFADMKPHTVFGWSGTYCVKMVIPVLVKEGGHERWFHAFDLHQSRLVSMPENARGFIVEGHFVEGAKPK